MFLLVFAISQESQVSLDDMKSIYTLLIWLAVSRPFTHPEKYKFLFVSVSGNVLYLSSNPNSTSTILSEDFWGFGLFHQIHKIIMKHDVNKDEVYIPDTKVSPKKTPVA